MIEQGQKLLAIEVKAQEKVTSRDARHLRTFLDEYPELARGALMFYTGDVVFWLARDILAVPWWLVM